MFGNNDRPGVMLAGAVSAYVNRFAARPAGARWSSPITTTAAGVIADLAAAGIEVAALVDPRPSIAPAVAALAERTGARSSRAPW